MIDSLRPGRESPSRISVKRRVGPEELKEEDKLGEELLILEELELTG
jgi:hypothetical protein